VCANIANLVLARSESRTKEIAVRAAIGAGRGRIIRQLLTESLVLSGAGGLVGLLVAVWGVRTLIAVAPSGIPRLSSIGIDPTVLGFTALISFATGLSFGLGPALRVASRDLHDSLKEGGHGSGSGAGRPGAGDFLVVTEVALVVVLTISAGLLVRSYSQLSSVEPGFNSENLLTMGIAARSYKYPDKQDYTAFFRDVQRRLDQVPGIKSVGMIRPFPLRSDTFEGETFSFKLEGASEPASGEEPTAVMRFTGPGYFRTMGIPLLAGRDFREDDGPDQSIVVIVNKTAAERYWPGKDPVGQRILAGRAGGTVIGVVGDIQQTELGVDPDPAVYVTYTQVARLGMTFVVRTHGEPWSMIGSIRQAVWEVNPDQPITHIATMEQVVQDSVAQPRFAMLLLVLFASLALVLAAVGIYGVIAYNVNQRTHEIGIRMALGAQATDVMWRVVGHGLILATTGITLGLLAAFVVTRFMSSILFQIAAVDPRTFIAVAIIVGAVSLMASIVPAIRAARIDPLIALRFE